PVDALACRVARTLAGGIHDVGHAPGFVVGLRQVTANAGRVHANLRALARLGCSCACGHGVGGRRLLALGLFLGFFFFGREVFVLLVLALRLFLVLAVLGVRRESVGRLDAAGEFCGLFDALGLGLIAYAQFLLDRLDTLGQ